MNTGRFPGSAFLDGNPVSSAWRGCASLAALLRGPLRKAGGRSCARFLGAVMRRPLLTATAQRERWLL